MKKTKAEVATLIASTKGKFFSVEYLKKNGERRVMCGKDKYNRLLKGGVSTLKDTEYTPVVDVNLEAFRAVSTDLIRFKCGDIDETFAIAE